MTAEEFHDWCNRPENTERWWELERGEVIELLPPTRPHGVICVNVAKVLFRYLDQGGTGYLASNDSGVILSRAPDTVRGPDVAFYDDAETFEELHPKYGEAPPRLAVEVVSLSDRPGRLMDKVMDYLNSGVSMVWVVDPETLSLRVCLPNRNVVKIPHDGEFVGEEILKGFRFFVSELFRLPKQKPSEPTSKQ